MHVQYRIIYFLCVFFSNSIKNGIDYTGIIITLTSTSSWNKIDQSKVAYHLTQYIQANNNEVEFGGNVFAVINEPFYVPNVADLEAPGGKEQLE